jgi:fibronectin-binding autotransporter adhesin
MKTTDKNQHPPRFAARTIRSTQALSCLLASCLIGAMAPSANAASDSWTGATDSTWATSGNWLGGNIPGAGDTATFDAASANTTLNLGGGVTISNVLFDTANAAAYTLGSGAVGSQTLTLSNNSLISLSSTVVNNQSINATLALPTGASPVATLRNDSASTLTIAGAVNSVPASGNGVLNVTNGGPITISGVITETGAGNNALFKRGSGTLTLSGGSTWSGSGASSGGFGGPLFAQQGVLILNGTNTVNGEPVIGGVVVNGGAGQNAKIQVDGGLLNITSWFSVGRGNGLGGVSSDLELNNNARVTTINLSAGFNGGSTLNLPRGSITLNGTSSFQANGAFYLGESPGADFTMTVNSGTAVTNVNAAGMRISSSGKALVLINGGKVVTEGDFIMNYSTSGSTNGSTVVLNGGELHVAGSTPSSTAERWLIFKRTGTSDTDLVVSNNGTVKLNNQTDLRFCTTGGGGSNTVTVVAGGAIIGYSDRATTVGGDVLIDLQQNAGASGATNVFNLNSGGIAQVRGVISAQTTGMRIWNFNGGTLKPNANNPNFLNLGSGTGVARVNVRNGGAIFDTAGFDVSTVSELQHSDIAGDNATDGGLTKNGAGTLTLSGGYSYSGATVVNAGTLTLDAAMVTPGTPGNITVNAAGLSVATAGTSIPAANLSFTGTSTLGLSFTTLSPGGAVALSATGTASSSGTTTININAAAISGVINGAVIPLISAGSAMTTSGFVLGTLPPGIQGVLTNNTSTSLALLITNAGQSLSWRGVSSDNSTVLTNWNVNVDANWYDEGMTNVNYFQGDNVMFADNGFNTDGTNYVSVPASVTPSSVKFSANTPYLLAGPAGISGLTSVVLTNNATTVFMNTTNTYTGGTVIAGGTLAINSDNALGATSGNVVLSGTTPTLQVNGAMTSTRAVAVNTAATLGVATNVTAQLGGAISGTGSITKTDNGTLSLSGNNTNGVQLNVTTGTLNITGTNDTTGLVVVGNTAGKGAVLNVTGNLRTQNDPGQFAGSLRIGNVSLDVASARMTSGTLSTRQQIALGGQSGSYGAFSLTGGNVTVGSYIVAGFASGDFAVLNQSGGTLTITNNLLTIAAGNDASTAVASFSGGVFNSTATNNAGAFVGEFGTGTLNVSGSAQVNLSGAGLRLGHTATGDGTVNLLGGTVTANSASKGPGTSGYLNFNGGTLKASGPSGAFITGMTAATLYSGGGTIDDGGYNVSVGQPLVAPTGGGISSITVSTAGSGYINTPIVTITGDGTNATAVATVSGGQVTGIAITSPGVGYTFASASLSGGVGSEGTAASLNTPVITANVSGGLTKLGVGTLNLTGTNTYTGQTRVGQGTLIFTPAHQVTAGSVLVSNGATFAVSAVGNGITKVGNLTAGTTSSSITTLGVGLTAGTNPISAVLECGTLTLNGTNRISLSGLLNPGTFPLIKYTGAIAGTGFLNPNVMVPHGYSATISNNLATSTLYVIVSGSGGIVWQGYNTSPGKTNLWDLNNTTNWLSGATPSDYVETTPPGDKVVFDDTGSGLVILSNTASPASFLITNVAKSYTFQGPGRVSGITGVTKNGSGAATMAFTGNDYTGSTIINDGTLTASGGTAIGDTSAVTLANATGANLVIATTETIGSLSGGGATGGNVNLGATLVINGSSSTTFGGQATGSGWFQLQGTGSMTVTGNVSSAGQVFVGGGSTASAATLNIPTGGTVAAADWWVVARDGSMGTVNINGGTLLHTGFGNITLGTLGTNPKGTINLNSGIISNVVGSILVGEGSSAQTNVGTLNQAGGVIYTPDMTVGDGNASIGTVNFTAGTMNISGELHVGDHNNNAASGIAQFTMSPGAVVNANAMRVPFSGSANSSGYFTNNGGTLNINAALEVTRWDAVPGGLTLNSGNINLYSNATLYFAQQNNSATGTFDQNGGNVTFFSDSGVTVGGTGYLDMDLENGGTQSSGNYTYNLNGGVLTVPRIQKTEDNASTTTFNFNGGTLKAAASSLTFMQGVGAANVRTGGAIVDSNGKEIAVDQALLNNGVEEDGGLTKNGNGTLYLNGLNTYTNTTTVNAGALGGVGTIAGSVVVNGGGALAPGGAGTIGTLTVNGDLGLAGNLQVKVNTGVAPSNDVCAVVGSASYTGSGKSVIVNNLGPALVAGDTFKLFNSGVSGAQNLAVTGGGAGVVWTNELASLGQIRVLSASAVPTTPTNLTYVVSPGNITLSWPASYLGWSLQTQTNLRSVGLSTNWVTVPNSSTVTTTNFAVSPASPTVFYRLFYAVP